MVEDSREFVSFYCLDYMDGRRVRDSTGREQPGKPGVEENDRVLDYLNLRFLPSYDFISRWNGIPKPLPGHFISLGKGAKKSSVWTIIVKRN